MTNNKVTEIMLKGYVYLRIDHVYVRLFRRLFERKKYIFGKYCVEKNNHWADLFKLLWQELPDNKRKANANAKNNMSIILALGVFFSAFLAFMVWYIEFSWQGTFDEKAITFKGSNNTPNILPLLNTEGKPLVVHFVEPNCECNRFSKEHLDHLEIVIQKYVQKLTIYTDGSPSVPGIDPGLETQLRDWVPATPSTAVWDSKGKLAYFGPYSSGLICGKGTDLVLFTMKNLALGNNPQWINQEAVGCYCENNSFAFTGSF